MANATPYISIFEPQLDDTPQTSEKKLRNRKFLSGLLFRGITSIISYDSQYTDPRIAEIARTDPDLAANLKKVKDDYKTYKAWYTDPSNRQTPWQKDEKLVKAFLQELDKNREGYKDFSILSLIPTTLNWNDYYDNHDEKRYLDATKVVRALTVQTGDRILLKGPAVFPDEMSSNAQARAIYNDLENSIMALPGDIVPLNKSSASEIKL